MSMAAARVRRSTVSIASGGASNRVTVSPGFGAAGQASSGAGPVAASPGTWQMSAGHRLKPAWASRTIRIA